LYGVVKLSYLIEIYLNICVGVENINLTCFKGQQTRKINIKQHSHGLVTHHTFS